jgi:hypothetical protein
MYPQHISHYYRPDISSQASCQLMKEKLHGVIINGKSLNQLIIHTNKYVSLSREPIIKGLNRIFLANPFLCIYVMLKKIAFEVAQWWLIEAACSKWQT